MASRSWTHNRFARRPRNIRKTAAWSQPFLEALEERIVLSVNFLPAVEYSALGDARTMATGDFNDDSHPDLVIANPSSGNISVMLGNGDGSFADGVSYDVGDPSNGPWGVAIGDFNGDGKEDVVTANSTTASVSVLLGNGDGTFQSPINSATAGGPTFSAAVGDFNGDGRQDVAVAGDNGVSVLMGNGDGTFQSAVSYAAGNSPDGVAVGDFNGDGSPDLVVADKGSIGGETDTVSVLMGTSTGTFNPAVDYAIDDEPTSVVVADVNGDHVPDVVTANFGSSDVSVLLGTGTGAFNPAVNYATGQAARTVIVGDFDADGRVDLATADFVDNTASVLLGNGDGSFQSPVSFFAGTEPFGAAVGDFNGDGRPDIAIGDTFGGSVSVLLNSPSANSAPTDIALSASSVPENQPSGTTIGTFSTVDPDTGDTFTYSLASGTGDTDNTQFTIVGNQLQTAASFDFEAKSSYSILVQSTDSGGLSIQKIFTISVTNVNEPPIVISDVPSVTVNEGTQAQVTGTFSDPEGQSTVTLTASLGTVTQNNDNGTWIWTYSPPDGPASPTVTITATDSGGLNGFATFNLIVNNVAPTITAFSVPATGAEGSPVVLSASATDPAGANDPLTFTWTIARPDGSVFTTLVGAQSSFTPPDNGNYGVSLTVSDGDGGTATRTAAPAGLVSLWKGEGNATDALGGNNGSLTGGVTFAAGEVGSAFNFSGTNQLSIPSSPSLDLTTAVTLEAWIKPSSLALGNGFGAIIAKSSGTTREYGFYLKSNGALHLSYFNAAGANIDVETAANLVPVNQFSHVAAVIDTAGGVMQIYLNGKLVASRTTSGAMVANSVPVTIGLSDPGSNFGFKGLIDEPSVYNRALSLAQIQSIVSAGSVGKVAPVVVVNVAPTITAFSVPAMGAEGSPVSLSASATDPAGANDPLTYTWTIIGPGGSVFTTLVGAQSSFTPPDNGNYGVSLTVDDGDGGTATRTAAPAGLVSLWKGEGNATDALGSNNGSLTGGVTFAAGEVGSAFNFSGTNQLSIPSSPSLDLTSAVTLEAWIKPSSLTLNNNFGAIIAKSSGTTREYSLYLKSNGALHLSYFNAAGTNVDVETAANLVPVNQFSHVAAVIDTAGGVMQIYLNGKLVASRTTSGAMVANSVPVTIGLSDPGSNFGFKGLIDEPSVYNRALSLAQIQSIVSAGSVGKVAPVVVVNVAPTPAIQGFSSGLATQALTFTASATDPSTVDQAAGFAYHINWGDGSPAQAIAQTAGNGSGVSLSHTFTTAGTYTVTLTATDKDQGAGSVSSTVTVLAVTSANLQTAINQQGSLTFQGTTDAQAQSVTSAINGLPPQATPTTLTLNLGSGSYTDTTASPPAGTTLVINGSGGTTTIVGHSPALKVTGGSLILSNVTLVTTTDAPTLEVLGGNLTLRNVVIEESTTANQAALYITGGTVDLGTAASPGGNVFDSHGRGELIFNAGASAVSALGDTFQADGVTITSPYRIKDEIFDALNLHGGGLVTYVANNVYVTQTSGSIERGVDAVAAGGTVNVEAGWYQNYDAGSKLVTIAFEDGPTLSQTRDPQNLSLRDVVVTGTERNDRIQFNPGGGLTVQVNGLPSARFAPTGRIVAYGLGGNDQIHVSGGVGLPALLFGGDGNDQLQAGGGDSVLVGGAGNDQLHAGRGRDLLIGGSGADLLQGNAGDDLLIAGTTAFDANDVALSAIMAEWTSSRGYSTRIANLSGTASGPRANGNFFLKPGGPNATVFDDHDFDILIGGSGMDWFFADLWQDIVLGWRFGERVDLL